MLEFCVKASVVDAEEDVYVHMLYSEYAALTGRGEEPCSLMSLIDANKTPVFAHQGKEATQPRDEVSPFGICGIMTSSADDYDRLKSAYC